MKSKMFLSAVLLSLSSLPIAATAQAKQPLRLVGSTPLPEITGGDFDHFAVDLEGNRLYVVSEVYASIEVFDLHTGAHLKSVRDVVKSPRKIQFLQDKHALLVADGGAASCVVLDTTDFHLIARVPLEAGPDAGAYDAASHLFYVSNGGRAAHQGSSWITAISTDDFKVKGKVEIPALTLKTIVLDPKRDRLYTTMRDKSQIAVVNLKTNSVEAIWSNPVLHTDSAMTLDSKHERVFTGNRSPGQFVVLDALTGTTIATLPIGDTSDDMTYDEPNRRIYVTSADGLDVIEQQTAEKYSLVQHIDTMGGKTSVYVPSLHRFYVVHTKGEKAAEAGLQIFEVQ